MITIIAEDKFEYEAIMEFAEEYVCGHTSFPECRKTFGCDRCFKENHIKAGIRVIFPGMEEQ